MNVSLSELESYLRDFYVGFADRNMFMKLVGEASKVLNVKAG